MKDIWDYVRNFIAAFEDGKVMMALKASDMEYVIEKVGEMLSMKQEDLDLRAIWRVKVYPNGFFEINDFTLPSKEGKLVNKIPQAEVPKWIQDSIAVLQIVDDGVTVDGVGKKISESVYYVTERVYGDEARSEGQERHQSYTE